MVRSWASWAKIARCRLVALAAQGWRVAIREVPEDRFDRDFPLDPGVEAMIRDDTAGDVALTFLSPLDYDKLPRGVPLVGQLDYEGSTWPAAWVERADTLLARMLVPSTFNRDTLVACGISGDRVAVVPYGFDPYVFQPAGRQAAGSGKELRLAFVGTPARRKGLDILVNAVRVAFSPSEPVTVRIHIVDYPDLSSRPYLDQLWRSRVERLVSEGYSVTVTTEMQLDEGMADLYRSTDLLCHTFRAESFCIPLVEAMACGTPILATAWGGPQDFLDATVGFPISRYDVVPAGDVLLDNGDGNVLMAEPPVDEVAKKLREAFEDRTDLARRGVNAVRRAAAFAWPVSSVRLADVLIRAAGQAQTNHNCRLSCS